MMESAYALNPRSYGLNESLWDFVPFNSVVFFQEGPGLRNWQWTSSGMKVINVKNILWNRTVNTNNSDKYISLNEFEKSYKHFELDDKDIVMASSGNTYSKIGRINSGNLPLMMNTSVIRFKSLNEELLNNDFLYFFLCSNYMKNQIDCFVTGSAQPNFGPYHLNRMSLPIPSIKAQKKIADILSAYDDLIENNLKRIKLLEQAAQNIYKEWFVNLRYPGHENTPINEETRLPEGWEKKMFNDVSVNNNRKRIPLNGTDRSKRQGNYRYYGATGVMDYIDDYIFDGRFLLVAEDGTVYDKVGNAYTQLVEGKFWVNNHAHIISVGSLPVEYLYLAMKHYPIGHLITGAVQLKLSMKNLKRVEVISPSEEILEKFMSAVNPMINQVFKLNKQNQKLEVARDILLPRLMNRTIEV